MSARVTNGFGADFDAAADLQSAERQRRRSTPERFWSKVDRSGGPEVCWPWLGERRHEGYGRLKWCGRDIGAHRVAYSLAKGPISGGMVVMHACDNPTCCNPAHLSLGSVEQNNEDMRRKGRGRNGAAVYIGERNNKAKLTEEMVRELRAAWRAGESIKSIAARTGLAVGTVNPMLHGNTWAHVTEAA